MNIWELGSTHIVEESVWDKSSESDLRGDSIVKSLVSSDMVDSVASARLFSMNRVLLGKIYWGKWVGLPCYVYSLPMLVHPLVLSSLSR